MILRGLRESDGDALIAANLANAAYHAPWVRPPVERAAFDAFFGRLAEGRHASMIALMPDGAILGVFNFGEIVLANFRSAYLGYYGMREYAGRGLMTACLRASLIHARDALGLHRVEANIQPANHRSISLVRRLGFRREGFSPGYLHIDGAWRDHERWAVLLEGLEA